MSSKLTGLFIIIFFLIFAILFGLWGFRNKIGPSKIQNSSLVEEFARTIPGQKESSQGGILPEPPREALKKAEQLIKNRLKTEAKIDYKLTDVENLEKYNYEVIAYVSPQPFKWRIDLTLPTGEGDLRYNYINNGNTYFSCNSKTKKCINFLSFSGPQFLTPFPLTYFLNTVLDILQLKKFVRGTKESQKAKIESETRTIRGRESDCTSGVDEYGTMEICVDQKTGLLLSLDVRTKLRHYYLEYQRIDISPISSEVFSPPFPKAN